MRKGRRLLAWIPVIVVVCLLVILGLEAAGRTVMHFRYGVPGKKYGRWRADPVLGARMAANVYDHRWQTNDRGFRNDEDLIEPKPPGSWRVIAYGGSTTLCWNLPTAETWPARLQQRLREATGNSGHQVLNAGEILWSIGHVYARARTEIPEIAPDFVILYTGINEVGNAMLLGASGQRMEDLVRAGRYGVFTRRLPQNSWLARNSIVYRLLHKLAVAPLGKHLRRAEGRRWAHLLLTELGPEDPAIPPDRYVLENYLHVLRELIGLCREYGATPVFVIQAHGLPTVGLDHFTSYSREGAVVARELGAPVVDAQKMVDAYDGDPIDLFRDSGIHYSAKGSSMLADLLCSEFFLPLWKSRHGQLEGDSARSPALSSPR